MNKLLFNEGGQPVYLDDLKILQETPQNQIAQLLSAFGSGETSFLLASLHGDIISIDTTTHKTTTKVHKNWLVEDGLIYEIPETTIVVSSWNDPIYVGIKTTEGDARNFEDGQSHPCTENQEAYLSTVKTDESMINVWGLKTIFSLMGSLMSEEQTDAAYKDIDVSFSNGYSGTVQYKELSDCYRIKVKISSTSTAWGDNTSGIVFSIISPDSLLHNVTRFSTYFATGGDTPDRMHQAYLQFRWDGTVTLVGITPSSDTDAPDLCTIDTIFEIPKN